MPELLSLFISVPLITAIIGWLTNWAAVKMIFYPETFVGIGPIGWQGILYKQGDKFAGGVADMVDKNLLSAREIAERIDLGGLQELIGAHLEPEIPELCRALGEELVAEGAWEKLPDAVRELICAQVAEQTRLIGGELFVELRARADELIDLHSLTFRQLSGENVSRLARLTKRIGQSEFKFIEYYGGVFGLIIGLVQAAVWTAMQTWWLLPLVGIVVGVVTNWLAIQMIFRPQEPTKYFFGLFEYQGLFAKRQAEIARDYGESARTEILTPQVFIGFMTEGEAGARLMATVEERVSARLRGEWQKYQAMIPGEFGDAELARARALIGERLAAKVATFMPEVEAYLEKQLDIGRTVEERLANLPKSDFERVLRGIFEEDELTLILVGGFLGGLVGLLQWVIVVNL